MQKSDLAKNVELSTVEFTKAPFKCKVKVRFLIETAIWFQSIMLIEDLKLVSILCMKLGVELIDPFLKVVFCVVLALRLVPLSVMLKVFPQSSIVPLELLEERALGTNTHILTLASVIFEISWTKGLLNLIDEFRSLEKFAD